MNFIVYNIKKGGDSVKIFFVIGSVTAATRLIRELYKSGIKKASVVNTPTAISSGGCSYSIKSDESEAEQIYLVARRKNIKVKGVYREIESGEECKYESISG